MFASDHSLGDFTSVVRLLKRSANMGPSSDTSTFKTLGCSSSGPKPFEGFKP